MSSREILGQSGELSKESKARVKWVPGEALYQVVKNSDNESVTTAAITQDRC